MPTVQPHEYANNSTAMGMTFDPFPDTMAYETLSRARLAPVMFLFERKGSVRISLDEADDLDAKWERVVDVALNAGAEDFENDEPSEGVVEVEVSAAFMSIEVNLSDKYPSSNAIQRP